MPAGSQQRWRQRKRRHCHCHSRCCGLPAVNKRRHDLRLFFVCAHVCHVMCASVCVWVCVCVCGKGRSLSFSVLKQIMPFIIAGCAITKISQSSCCCCCCCCCCLLCVDFTFTPQCWLPSPSVPSPSVILLFCCMCYSAFTCT